MKRLIFAVSICAAAALFVHMAVFAADSQTCGVGHPNHLAGFTCPILVGGESANAVKTTSATHIKFITHPEDAGWGNFNPDYDAGAPDVVATPGDAYTVSGGNQVFYSLPKREDGSILTELNAIGPSDLELIGENSNYFMKLDFQSSGNNKGRHLLLGDIRKEMKPNEFKELFGKDPLEEGLIGNAGHAAPYDAAYPSAPISGSNSFLVCAPSGGMPYYWNCDDERPHVDNDPFADVFLYDLAVDDDVIVSASYDPFIMKVDSEVFATGAGWKKNDNPAYATYISPLAFFIKDKADKNQYKFLGYTSWRWPKLQVDSTDISKFSDSVGKKENADEIMKALYSNPWLPIASNPIAVDVMKQPDGKKMYAVTYQNTLFDISNRILNPYGRPMIFPDGFGGFPYRYHSLLGRKVGGQFVSLSSDTVKWFPSGIVSPVVFWKQKDAFDFASYEGMNPSNVVEPSLMVLISSGVKDYGAIYDAAVVKDFRGTANEKELLLIPSSTYNTSSTNTYMAMVYVIDPFDEKTNLWMKSWKMSPSKVTTEVLTEMPNVKLPVEFIDVPSGDHAYNFIPYQIRVGNLDGDECGDFTLTWRGYQTISDGAKGVRFTNENDKMFANFFTIVLRSPHEGKCAVSIGGKFNVPMPDSSMVSSVAIGDVDNDESAEIVAGNLKLEKLYDSSTDYAAHAYVIELKKDVDGKTYADVFDVKKLRVGFEKFDAAKKDSEYGAGYVEVAGDSISVINGRPLMLPIISCPVSSQYPNYVGSLFETLSSVMYDMKSKELSPVLGSVFKGGADKKVPIPPRCVEEWPDICTYTAKGGSMILPLWQEDCDKLAKDADDDKLDAHMLFNALCVSENEPKAGTGYVNCPMLYAQYISEEGGSGSGANLCGNGQIDTAENCDMDKETGQIVYSSYLSETDKKFCSESYCKEFCICNKCGDNDLQYSEECEIVPSSTPGATKYLVWSGNGAKGQIIKNPDGTITSSPAVDPDDCPICKSCKCQPVPVSGNDKKDGETSRGPETEFAGWRPDAVYSSNDRAIAFRSDMRLAAEDAPGGVDQPEEEDIGGAPKTLTGYFSMHVDAMRGLSQEKLKDNAEAKKVMPASCALLPEEKEALKAIRIPHGAVMPGHREITAVIPYKNAAEQEEQLCGNNKLDPEPEDCDIVDGNLVHQPDIVDCTGCTAQCRCYYGGDVNEPTCGNNILDAGEDCDVVNGKVEEPEGCICSGDCKCTYPPVALIDEMKPEEPSIEAEMPAAAPVPIISDCFTLCRDHSTNEYAQVFDELNEKNYRSVTQRADDFFCEPGQKVKVVCYVRNAFKSTTAGGETTSVANPYMITQDGGFRFDPPETESKVQDFVFMRSPERIVPLAGPATGQTIASTYTMPALPDLSMAGDVQIIKGGIAPMAAESVIHAADGSTTIINNMIKHTIDMVLPDNFSASSGVAQMFKGALAPGESGSSDGLHTTEFILPSFAIFGATLDSGQQMIKNLENQGISYDDLLIENQPTSEDVKAYFEAEKAKALMVGSGITYDAPWAKHLHYKFSLISQPEDAASMPTSSSLAVSQFSFAATDIVHTYGGIQSGCKCRMSANTDIDLKAILALMAFVLITSGGVAAVRVFVHIRRRRR